MSELDDLKAENKKLKTQLIALDFSAKLNRFLADQRADAINDLLASKPTYAKNAISPADQEILKKMVERIKFDNDKYEELQKFLMKTFPKVLKVNEPQKEQQKHVSTRDDLSTTYIGENGEVYIPKHIIDVTILLMSKLKEQIESILGSESGEDEPDIF